MERRKIMWHYAAQIITMAVALLTAGAGCNQPVMAANPTTGLAANEAAAKAATREADDLGEPFVYEDWTSYTMKNGLPNDHVFYVKADGDRVWVGTEHGLAVFENGTWRSWRRKDGLAWDVIAGIDVSRKTGDVWLATFGGGLIRFTGGRFDQYHQLNSGLVNDVVYGVACQDDGDEDIVWAATTAGFSSYNVRTGEWAIYTEKNCPLEEIWCYNVTYNDGFVYGAVWGGGILEWDCARKRWKAYHDPDGEMEYDLYRDDGLIHIITTGVSYVDRALWCSTYFGGSRYDGRHWRGYLDHDSGLASNFNNFVQGRSANEAWYCTDKGLSVLVDYPSDTWVTYVPNIYVPDRKGPGGIARIMRGSKVLEVREMPKSIPHNYVLCVDFQGDDVWVGTSKGLAHGSGRGRWPGLRVKPRLARR